MNTAHISQQTPYTQRQVTRIRLSNPFKLRHQKWRMTEQEPTNHITDKKTRTENTTLKKAHPNQSKP